MNRRAPLQSCTRPDPKEQEDPVRLNAGRSRRRTGLGSALAVLALALGLPAAASAQAPTTPGSEPTASEQLDARLAAAESFREDFGLRSDPGYISGLEEDADRYAAGTEAFGVPLTSGELDALDSREDAADAIEPVVRRYVERRAADEFAGFYIDQDEGGTVKVGFTEDVASHIDALRTRSPRPALVEGFHAGQTLRELERSAGTVTRALDELAELGAHSVSVDVSAGAVEVAAEQPGPALESELAERFPDAPLRVVAEPPAQLAANYSRFPVPPMVGAIEIFRQTSGGRTLCSAGFVARQRGFSRKRSRDRVVTAGHCAERGDLFKHHRSGRGAYRIGRVQRDAYQDGSTADALTIRLRQGDGRDAIYTPGRGQPGGLQPIRRSQPRRQVTEGEIVCRSGGGSDFYLGQGVYCGQVTHKSVNANVFPGPTFLRRQVQAEVTTCLGDSGGPVYRNRTAKGIVSALSNQLLLENRCGRTLLFSHVGAVENKLRVRVPSG